MAKPSVPTAKTLFALSGNHCAFPGCKNRLIDEQTNVLAARICHIKGNREGSARHDKNQPDEERQSLANLVAMCPNHADIIDNKANVATYTVEWLLDVKQKHERKYRGTLPPADDLAERFAIGTLHTLLSGPVVMSANQSGGQTANTINNYQYPPEIGRTPRSDGVTTSQGSTPEPPSLSEQEFKILVVVGKQQHATVREVASAVHVSEEKAKFYLDELDRKHRLVDRFMNMDHSIPDRYLLTHKGRRLLVERRGQENGTA